mmetsp:Transcript_45060/g.143794  ORF Transcript_45060/g.143794 Transcript_45060/m.143794 type:complete len:214 (-) Transcript_45060:74-715(-)
MRAHTSAEPPATCETVADDSFFCFASQVRLQRHTWQRVQFSPSLHPRILLTYLHGPPHASGCPREPHEKLGCCACGPSEPLFEESLASTASSLMGDSEALEPTGTKPATTCPDKLPSGTSSCAFKFRIKNNGIGGDSGAPAAMLASAAAGEAPAPGASCPGPSCQRFNCEKMSVSNFSISFSGKKLNVSFCSAKLSICDKDGKAPRAPKHTGE